MIIDSHAHAFPPMGGPSGHRATVEHMKYVQHLIMNHQQPVRSLSDNSMSTTQTLYDGEDLSVDGLTEVDFRGGAYGRFTWTAGGRDYYKQYLPPTLTRLAAPPELMVAQMDHAGVDKTVLQTGHVYGRLNRYLADAVESFPERFWALAMVDEWRADHPSQVRALDRAIEELGLHGLWFMSSNIPLHGRTETIDDPVFHSFWDHVREMGTPVWWFVTPIAPGREAYMAELAAFERWNERYSDIPVFFTHGLPLLRFMENGKVSIPSEAWRVLDAPNVMFEILLPIFLGAVYEYPFVEVHPVIREYYQRLGPDRLVWGSDMPNVERHCTYKQSLDYLRLHCDFIPSDDMAKICGGNLARLLGAQDQASLPLYSAAIEFRGSEDS